MIAEVVPLRVEAVWSLYVESIWEYGPVHQPETNQSREPASADKRQLGPLVHIAVTRGLEAPPKRERSCLGNSVVCASQRRRVCGRMFLDLLVP